MTTGRINQVAALRKGSVLMLLHKSTEPSYPTDESEEFVRLSLAER